MKTVDLRRHFWPGNLPLAIVLSVILCVPSLALNTDGVLLLSFRYSVVDDPLSTLQTWRYDDITPCSWHGVTCDNSSHVTALSLPSSSLLGSVPSDLGTLPALQRLDLSNNSINGSLPVSLFNATELRFLDLSNNLISGELPVSFGGLQNLQVLNLSDNALVGKLPASISSLGNLTVVSLKNNYFSGEIPGGFRTAEFLDLSSNLINGSLPTDFGGNRLRYLNVSYNRLSGEIPPGFADEIPENASVDLSFNDLMGQIPNFRVFENNAFKSFLGNPGLCRSDSTQQSCQKSSPPPPPAPQTTANVSSPSSPPALAAIPKTIGSNPLTDYPNGTESGSNPKPGLKPGIIVGIIVGDIAGIAILGIVIFYFYQSKKKRIVADTLKRETNAVKDTWSTSSYSSDSKGFAGWSCLRKAVNGDGDNESETTGSEPDEENRVGRNQRRGESDQDKKGTFVNVVDSEELELETLLKASAYILGATGSSIMYKAVLQDGSAVAVRRIGESGLDRFREFETQVRAIAKLVHPNLVRIRGFYFGTDEKLIIYDFVPNGSLANARYRKVGSSPCHLPWVARLRIARGVARGLTYIHEKKHVHGNLKPSNILLGFDMEPKISDLGLERVLTGDTSYRPGGSARIFGSKRSTSAYDYGPGPSPSPSPSSVCSAPYNAPESLRTLKPNPKWDVYSFGVIMLELLTGKIIGVDDEGQANGVTVEEKERAMRMVDGSIRAELEGKEEAVWACFKMGLACASPIPQRRPSMKDALHVLDRFPLSPFFGQ
ncbi:PREDICTED: probable LRR receptor-like serine/threonine-protein kinase At4g37250 [Tarenaya hassleriana]|uniref:probable LRR receptor-like serine/threonine-protein kinase At4g37250 n=1 Tax=Tarenaya hassleriana TaxID=28532 RepID=UPI00053C22D2|nr:PREDICTED: probable LRR receptor-like serine/threonine-protein kinase At4g37250 [Tarenaya hassleriana]